MKIKEIYEIVPESNGWRKLPDGNCVKLGDYVTLGNSVTLGDYVKLGNDVKLGDYVKLGNGVKLGDYVTLGNNVKLSDYVIFKQTPLQIQCHPYPVYPFSSTEIGVGCVVHSIDYWLAGEPSELTDHPECQPWQNYQDAIALVAEWMKRQ